MHINKRRLLKSTRWFNNIKIQHLPLYFKYKIFPNLSSKIFDESTLITSRSLSRYYVIKMLNEEIILRSSVFFFGLRTFITCAMGWLNSQSIFVMHELLNLYFYFTKKKKSNRKIYFIAKILSIDMLFRISCTAYGINDVRTDWLENGWRETKKNKNLQRRIILWIIFPNINSTYNFWSISISFSYI